MGQGDCPLCEEEVVQTKPDNEKLSESGFDGSHSNTLHIHLFFFHGVKIYTGGA